MKVNDLLNELSPSPELGAANTSATSTVSGPGLNALGDPATQAAMLVKQKQNITDQRKAIQDRITVLTKEVESLRKQLATLR